MSVPAMNDAPIAPNQPQNPFTKPLFGTKPTFGAKSTATVTPGNRFITWLVWLFIIFVALPTGCNLLGNSGTHSGPIGISLVAPKYSLTQYNQLQNGMSHAQVAAIMGDGGQPNSHVEGGGFVIDMYSWANGDGSNCNAQFQNDQLQAKAQFGLR